MNTTPSVPRVVLIQPPSPERRSSPLLGQQYLAAALLSQGCEVCVIDAGASHFPPGHEAIVVRAEAFEPHLVGISLHTRWVQQAYRLLDELRGRFAVLVAGGPHATACPAEALDRGFDVVVEGEAEHVLPRLAWAVAARKAIESVPGLHVRGRDGGRRRTAPAEPIADLDALPLPGSAAALYDPGWYAPGEVACLPGGILATRGCPARCTFCANLITGRTLRKRTPASVVAELNAAHACSGRVFHPFWDDALTADRHHTLALCDAIARGIDFDLHWSAITRATHVSPELLRAMRGAGLVHINFGVESGDDEVLRRIGKGIRTAHVVRALEWAAAEGLRTTCNFMLGFPGEGPANLERTLAFMGRIAPLTTSFSSLGVVVPMPGTALYEAHRRGYGFTDWWLDERGAAAAPVDSVDDVNLELDFFHYDAVTRDLIRACLQFKAEHNRRVHGTAATGD